MLHYWFLRGLPLWVMRINVNLKHLIFLFSVLLCGCNSIKDNATVGPYSDSESDYFNRTIVSHAYVKKAAEELQLKEPDGIKTRSIIRFWFKNESTNGGQVIAIIEYQNKQRKCLDYSFVETGFANGKEKNLIETVTAFKVDTFWVKKKSPKSGWDSFLAAIEKESIYNLPSQSEQITQENNVEDGYTYMVQILRTNEEKFYWFNCPDLCSENHQVCKNYERILHLFNSEFDLNTFSDLNCR